MTPALKPTPLIEIRDDVAAQSSRKLAKIAVILAAIIAIQKGEKHDRVH